MAIDLHLEEPLEEVLRFVLDCTIAQWRDDLPGQLDIIATDPAYKSLEELMEAVGDQHELLERLLALRTLMDLEEVK